MGFDKKKVRSTQLDLYGVKFHNNNNYTSNFNHKIIWFWCHYN